MSYAIQTEQTNISTCCITGVGTSATIDYLSFTLPDIADLKTFIESVLIIPFNQFKQSEKGRLGYASRYDYDSITLLTLGAEPGMGHHIVLTGKACAEYKDKLGSLADSVFNVEGHFTRCDLKIDDLQGLLDMDEIQNAVASGLVVTKCKSVKEFNEYDKVTGEYTGRGAYFGSRKSNIFIRAYDKALEQHVDHHWLRIELELKNETADAVMMLSKDQDLGYAAKGLLKNYLSFRERGKGNNRSLWEVSPWWEMFLGNVEKLSITSWAEDPATQEKRLEWFMSNSRTFAELVDTCGPGVIPFMYQQGKQKISSKSVVH